jgi:hypothetical protein
MVALRIDELLQQIRCLPESERRELLRQAAEELREPEPADEPSFMGVFADEPELIERGGLTNAGR